MKPIFVLLVLLTPLAACQDNSTSPTTTPTSGPGANAGANAQEWLIPRSQVFDGGPGKDGIPALENPELISPAQATYLDPQDLVVGFVEGKEAVAYPHKILDWHEIINDKVGATSVAITYCPLTGTGIGWSRMINNVETTFGVSGLLYNTNLIPYDRATDSNWSQMRLDCVNGELKGEEVATLAVVETTWATWQQMYPDTKVVSTNTGFSRNYQRYPYGDYRTNNENIIFPVSNQDDRIPAKDRVLGVLIGGNAKIYPLEVFAGTPRLVLDSHAGKLLAVVGSQEQNFIAAFETGEKTLEVVNDALPVVMQDEAGNQYDVFGYAVDGPDAGSRLTPVTSYIGYYFAWQAFYPDAPIVFGLE
ncbi:MAG: DUF3179 domain-containing protein [Cyclobacteriaceae bacterium]|mgnify:CR=1 FL=1